MNKFRLMSFFVILAMLFSFANVSPVAATSPNPLDDGGWELVAHTSNSGGMFDGNGELMPNYSYGTFVANPVASTPDFQRAFPVVADKILFITGDGSIWGIADYGDLRTLIDARGAVYPFPPNLAFEIGVNGVISNTTGNVLSRPGVLEDPWITMDGGHYDGINNQRIVWGENNYGAGTHQALKNNHGGINVYVKAASRTGPQSCQDILDANPSAADGDYVIYPNNQMFTVYCHDMAGIPSEYLTLANTGGSSNFSQLKGGGHIANTDVVTHYTKVRLNPTTLLVDINDKTFSSSTGYQAPWNVSAMDYGVAAGCYTSYYANGQGNIDLRGTPFAVDSGFVTRGWNPAGSATFSSDDQVVNLLGGGACGWISPTGSEDSWVFDQDAYFLSLRYIPDVTSPTATFASVSPVANGSGWNKSEVTVTWTWSDEAGGSGIDNAACTTSSTSTGEGEVTLTATCKDLAGNEGSASYTVNIDQTLPVADAGSNQSIHAGDLVNLDGSASSDDNTTALSYNWSFDSTPAGNTATLNNSDTATPSFTPDVAGEYVAQLIVTDDADNDSEPVFVMLSSLNLAPTADATATPMLPILGQAVSLDGTGSSDPDLDTIYYQWTVTSKPVGSAASLTNATLATASITPDVSGEYVLTLTVSDFLEAGAPVTVSFVASTAEEFSQMQIISVSTVVVTLEPAEISTAGNQEAFGNFLTNTMSQIQKGNLNKAIADLERAIARTDGCALRGSPDGNGPGMDWVTTCDAQANIYNSLVEALQVLQN